MKPLPVPPPHSRWKILEEINPNIPKRQAKRTFRVRCGCGSEIERVLAYRYVTGESLSCGCLKRERAAEMGRANLDTMRVGYREYLQNHPKIPSKYGAKLPPVKVLVDLQVEGLTCQQIADKYGATASAVSKRLRKNSATHSV